MKDTKLFDLLKDFIFNAISAIDEAVKKRYFKPKYDNYPDIKYRESGMPDIKEYGNTPIKINDLFHSFSGKPDIEFDTLTGFNEVFDYLLNHKKFKEHNYYDLGTKEQSDNLFVILTKQFLIDILERYYLISVKKDKNVKLLENIYIPVENYFYADNLTFDIATPILFTNFGFDEYVIDKNIVIRRISEEYNKSRVSIKSYSPPVTSSLLSSATHELVLKNYHSKKPKRFIENTFSEESVYPHEKLELFFNALKIITNINTGYAQVLVYPHDWVESYKMDLLYLTGTSVKRYPSRFDNFYWNVTDLPNVSGEEINTVGNLYLELLENQNNKLRIANKKLRYSYLRDNEEDSILDIIIALETLLSDGDKGEITVVDFLVESELLSWMK